MSGVAMEDRDADRWKRGSSEGDVMLTYLASPYTSIHPAIREHRYEQAAKAAAQLMRQGRLVYSPIVHGHPLTVADPEMPGDFEFWMRHCYAMLGVCKAIVVLKLDGWEQSVGVRAEMEFALRMGLRIEFLEWSEPQPQR